MGEWRTWHSSYLTRHREYILAFMGYAAMIALWIYSDYHVFRSSDRAVTGDARCLIGGPRKPLITAFYWTKVRVILQLLPRHCSHFIEVALYSVQSVIFSSLILKVNLQGNCEAWSRFLILPVTHFDIIYTRILISSWYLEMHAPFGVFLSNMRFGIYNLNYRPFY